MKQLLYFAYGSNMNPARARERMPSAVFAGAGVLKDYVVAERLYADIDRRIGGEVHGILYRLSYGDLARLDRCEGFPSVYRRLGAMVNVGGRTVRAVTYKMTKEARKLRAGQRYPEEYRAICSKGAAAHGIPNVFAKQGERK